MSGAGLKKAEVQSLLTDAGYEIGAIVQPKNTEMLLRGTLSFRPFPSGISVHCGDNIEKESATSTTELPASLNIVILLEGKVEFSLGAQRFAIEAVEKQPVMFVSIVKKGEIFTRQLQSGQRVKKVNISIAKESLLTRCYGRLEHEQTRNMFDFKSQVCELPCSEDMVKCGLALLDYQQHPSLQNVLSSEQMAMQVISHALLELPKNQQHQHAQNGRSDNTDMLVERIKYQLDHSDTDFTLVQLAQVFNTSISTLQRRFKFKYKITIHEYLRRKRLQKARNAIVIDGLSIGEAAFVAGYSHVGNFLTAFKKEFTVTPSQLIKKHAMNE